MTTEQQSSPAMIHIESSATREGEPEAPAALPLTGEGANAAADPVAAGDASPATEPGRVREIGGRKDGPEPTRFGDWERNGRCVDF